MTDTKEQTVVNEYEELAKVLIESIPDDCDGDPNWLVAMELIAQALRQAEQRAYERAAVIAENRWRHWTNKSGVECDVTACAEIAAAIRSLAKTEGRG